MRARCWVHHVREADGGGAYYDRVYGDQESAKSLVAWLEARGVKSIEKMARGHRVIGNVASGDCAKPYFDRMRAIKAKGHGRAVWVVVK
jgi:hypothetical protein